MCHHPFGSATNVHFKGAKGERMNFLERCTVVPKYRMYNPNKRLECCVKYKQKQLSSTTNSFTIELTIYRLSKERHLIIYQNISTSGP